VEAVWKRQTAAKRSSSELPSLATRTEATDRSRSQHVLAPYKQEVARSSRAPPIAAPGSNRPPRRPLPVLPEPPRAPLPGFAPQG
jgi:hypothetical protein